MPLDVTPQSIRTTRAVDPQVRPLRWAGKAHSREGRLFLAIRAELVGHVGGKPSATERALIDRLAWLQVHLARMDARMMETWEMSEHTGKQYLAWANSVARMLGQLGLEAAPAEPPPRWVPYAARAAALAAPGQTPAPLSTRAERQALAAQAATQTPEPQL